MHYVVMYMIVRFIKNSVDESALIELVQRYERDSVNTASTISVNDENNLKSTEERYYYNYYTGKLTYEKTNYMIVGDVIVDNYTSEELNKM